MRTQEGFTVIELMVTLVVLAVLISIAIPSFTGMIRDNRNLAVRNELTSAIQMARSEALKRRTDVVLCHRNVAGTACANNANWSDGWLIRAPLPTSPVTYTVLKVWDQTSNVAVAGPNAGLTYTPSGMATATANFTVSAASGCTGQKQHQLAISRTGSITASQVDCP